MNEGDWKWRLIGSTDWRVVPIELTLVGEISLNGLASLHSIEVLNLVQRSHWTSPHLS
jgi:hypothetical protein